MEKKNIIYSSETGLHYRHSVTTIDEILSGLSGVTHSHPQYEVYYLISGDVTYYIAGQKLKIEKGSLLVLNAFESHSVQYSPSEDYERCVIEFTVDSIPTLDGINPLDVLIDKKTPFNIIPREQVEKTTIYKNLMLIEEETKSLDNYSNHIILSYILNIISQISRCIFNQDKVAIFKENERIGQSYVNETITYINNNISQKLTVEEISKAIGVSKSYLQHIFKATVGKSITTYISQQKLHIAKYMLSRGQSLTDVANALGFQYYSTFSHNYKKLYKVSPKVSQRNDITGYSK